MIVQLLLFPFGYFIALFIGGISGWYIGRALEDEKFATDLSCIFGMVAFIFAFFFTMSDREPTILSVLFGLTLCGLSGPIIGGLLYVLLAGGYHFRQWRLRMYSKITGRKFED
ncbi:MAG: hypothetical protein SGJ27_24000 [Candidatus Melainabacteria bacterium]|nr:hypothetical protein [Candidatus Melainabacteria bacterium]